MTHRHALSALAIVALAGTAHAQSVWNNPAGGDWNTPANWTPADVPNTSTESAVIALAGTYTVSLGVSPSIAGLTISNPNATLSINTGNSITVENLFNDGDILVNNSGGIFDSILAFSMPTVIDGSGTITLGALSQTGSFNDARLQSNTGINTMIASGITVRGNGTISGLGSFTNDGTILAQDPLGPGIQINTDFSQSPTGLIHADGGFVTLGSSAILVGGATTTSNGGVIDVSPSATVASVTNTGDLGVLGGSTLKLTGGLTNNATLTVNRDASIFDSFVRFDSNTTIDGTGQIILRATSATNDARITTAAGVVGTIGSGQTITGSGTLDGTLVLDGLVVADNPALPIAVNATMSGSGELRGGPGARVDLNAATVSNLTFGSSGGLVSAAAGTSFVSGVTITGDAGIRGGASRMALTGDITNNGVIIVNDNDDLFNAFLRFDGDHAINGAGEIRMVCPTSTNDAQIETLAGFTGTIGAGQTVRGAGELRGTLVLNGAAVADDPAFPLNVHADLSGPGTLRAENGAVLGFVSGAAVHGVTIDTGPGSHVGPSTGTSTVGNVTITGDAGITGGSTTMLLDGPVTNNGRIVINYDLNLFNAFMIFDTDTTIGGVGTVRMQAPTSTNDAQINTSAGVTGTFGSGQTVAGAGEIRGTIVNHGTFNGDDPAFPLVIFDDVSGSGTVRADGGTVALSSASVSGQTFDSSAGGIVAASAGTSSITDCVNTGDLGVFGGGVTLEVESSLTNNGNVIINSDANIFNAALNINTAAEIDGSGTFDLRLGSTDLGDATLRAQAGLTASFGAGQTITGSGRLRGDMTLAGTIDPAGNARQLDQAEGTLTLGPTATARFDLGGLNPGEFDRVTIGGSGAVALDGHLDVATDAGYVPVRGDSWDIFSGTTTGSFQTFDFPIAPFGSAYRVFYESGRVFVRLTCSADFDGDNQLNFFDVSSYIGLYNAQDPRADLASPFGVFNFFDIAAFINNFNAGCP